MRRLLILVAIVWFSLGAKSNPPVDVRIDRTSFELVASDPLAPDEDLRIFVALGSPAHPTPRGRYTIRRVILNPAWKPGPAARELGAEPLAPSTDGPMGVAKMPLAQAGAIAIHGGAHPLLLRKPVSLGCVRLEDAAMLDLIDWLDSRGALAPDRAQDSGEHHRAVRRSVRVAIQ